MNTGCKMGPQVPLAMPNKRNIGRYKGLSYAEWKTKIKFLSIFQLEFYWIDLERV